MHHDRPVLDANRPGPSLASLLGCPGDQPSQGEVVLLNRHLPPSAEDVARTDRALCAFLQARITELDKHACSAERKALAGVAEVLRQFEENCGRVDSLEPTGYFLGQMDALRWVLQRVAQTSFSAHPALREVLGPGN
jgi:hypothetical protein